MQRLGRTARARSIVCAIRLTTFLGLLLVALAASTAQAQTTSRGIWTSAAELADRPTRGAAWDALRTHAARSADSPRIADQDDATDAAVLAKALVYARTGEASYRTEVIRACMAAIGTEAGGRTLALGRNLAPYVIAADLVGLPASEDERFRAWLRSVLVEPLEGLTLISTHEQRPNNWGTHAGASRAAIAAYLGDRAELDRAARVLRGWLGDRSAHTGFRFGDLSWQQDAARPVGVNPVGASRDGHSIDGVLPDDQRRAGPFAWPPPKENYVYEALQGSIVQAVILSRAGYDVWSWSDRALLRAYRWLDEQASYPAEGDDRWQMHLVNHFYGTSFPAAIPTTPGKNMAFTDWTHPPGSQPVPKPAAPSLPPPVILP
jgi:hypothetical protein